MLRSCFIVSIVLMLSAVAVSAQDWKRLASKSIDLRNVNDTIVIKGKHRSYSKFKLSASGSSVRISRLVLTFSNGERRVFNTAFTIEKGESTNEVDLNGTKNNIQRVDLWYESRSLNASKAKVTIYGLPAK